MRNMLNQIHEDMPVYDRRGNKIGTVDEIQFGDENPEEPGVETATAKRPSNGDGGLIEDLARAFSAGDMLPAELRSRLIRYGFFKIDTGLLSPDRYVSADQIASVDGERVTLNVSEDDLIKV